MLFTGYSEHSIDAKGRLSVPSKYRTNWDESRDGSAWFALPWPGDTPDETTIRLYTERGFERLADTWEDSLTPDPVEAELQSALFSLAERLELDAQGRLRIPAHQLELTGLSGPVVLVGARSRLEVRSRDEWLARKTDRFQKLNALAARWAATKKD
ncbi:MAG: hypothetical protein AAF108_00635 [Planctomycetota bacterium]